MAILRKIGKIDFWLIPIFILVISNSSILFHDNVQIMALTGLLFLILFFKNIYIDFKLIFDILLLWLLINFFSIIFINRFQPYTIITVFSRFMYLVFFYFIVRLGGRDFFDKLNNYIYILALISLPLFAIQVIFPSIIAKVFSVFESFTYETLANVGSRYGYIYMFNTWHLNRNCGFMFEPGAYAGFLIFMLTYRLSINQFMIDKYIIVFLIALITTFSTAGYLSLTILFAAFIWKKGYRNLLLLLSLPVMFYFAFNFYMESDFLSEKINRYTELGTNAWGTMSNNSLRTSRLGYALIILDESIHWPFGHGVIEHSIYKLETYGNIIGPGALSALLHQWGWPAIITVFWSLYYFFRRRLDLATSILFTLSLSVVLFSNPWSFLYLIFTIMFFVFSYYRGVNDLDFVKDEKQEGNNKN